MGLFSKYFRTIVSNGRFFLFLSIAVYGVALIFASGIFFRHADLRAKGILAHPSGQAVYIAGESCTVNAGHMELAPWCLEAERAWNEEAAGHGGAPQAERP